MRATVLLLLLLASPALADEMRAPSPNHILYPGDIVSEDMLGEVAVTTPPRGGPVALAPEDVIGMMTVRTLLPGEPIPLAALSPPRVLRAGAPVKMIYVDGGLTITADGDALQDGVVGQMVKVRNEDSGVTVTGRVRSDGSVLVSGG
jgi:flagella basal body P-ring formation protein FlgA